MTITAYPLSWPPGWKRTTHRAVGSFAVVASNGTKSLSISQATQRLRNELGRMGVRDADLIISTNLRLRQDGLPYSAQAQPADPGAAAYWDDPWTGQPRCMAIDRYTKVEQNIAALAATIEAMRAIERHGGAVVLERAFTGFTALPAPIVAGMSKPWWEVLGISREAFEPEIITAWRRLSAQHHPDRGGSAERMAEVNTARDAALKERA